MPRCLSRPAILFPCVFFLIATGLLEATEIKGKVKEVKGKIVQVSTDSETMPNPGDKVQISFQIAGLDETVEVATGTVVGLEGDVILVNIIRSSGKIAKNQDVKIQSEKPRKKSEGMSKKSPPNPGVPTTPVPAGVLFSDTFEREGDAAASLGAGNLALGGSRKYGYLPLHTSTEGDSARPNGVRLIEGRLQNSGLDFAGVEFVTPGWKLGTDVGQNLNIKVDLLVPQDEEGHATEAGPFFRSRAAAAGDGVIGGRSAGYWVQLHSSGEVRIKCLNPFAVVAVSRKPQTFQADALHKLEMAARGNELQVALDGQLLSFDQGGVSTTTVMIPPTWEGPPSKGNNEGTAGLLFSAEQHRGKIGGQCADNLILSEFRPLTGLPTGE